VKGGKGRARSGIGLTWVEGNERKIGERRDGGRGPASEINRRGGKGIKGERNKVGNEEGVRVDKEGSERREVRREREGKKDGRKEERVKV
jgi:hypothetical protein